MTIEDTKQIVDKIKIYRPNFGGQFDKSGLDKLKLEWFRILEPYDYIDVDKKLDEFFKNGDNFGRYPDVYYLTKFLKTKEEKLNQNQVYAICPFCKSKTIPEDYKRHYHKCSSIQYLIDISKKYFNKNISRIKLSQMSEKEFDEFYWKVCNLLDEKLEESNLKHSLQNAILTNKGLKPKYDLEGLIDDK